MCIAHMLLVLLITPLPLLHTHTLTLTHTHSQCYDPRSNQWQSKAPLPIQRSGFSSAVVDNHLYLVGGCNNLSKVKTVDKYDPETNSWSSVASMSIRRSGLGVGVAPAFLF